MAENIFQQLQQQVAIGSGRWPLSEMAVEWSNLSSLARGELGPEGLQAIRSLFHHCRGEVMPDAEMRLLAD